MHVRAGNIWCCSSDVTILVPLVSLTVLIHTGLQHNLIKGVKILLKVMILACLKCFSGYLACAVSGIVTNCMVLRG